jgi:dynein heavy chain
MINRPNHPIQTHSIINTIITWVILLNQNTYVKFKLQEGMREAKSNIEFLQILKEPCDELDETTSPTDIPKIIPTLLQSVGIIWVNSPYFNTR